jgi:hypothetical protein
MHSSGVGSSPDATRISNVEQYLHELHCAVSICLPLRIAITTLQDCVVSGCGSITCSGKTSFANGIRLPLGLDGDGRLTPVYASMTVGEAAAYAQHLGDIGQYQKFVSDVVAAIGKTQNIFRCFLSPYL